MITKKALLPIVLTLLAAAPSAAQLVPMGPEFRVDGGVGPTCPAVAGRGDRGFTVAWRTEPPLHAHARSYNGAGVPVGGVIDVTEGLPAGRFVGGVTVQNRPGQGDLVLWDSSRADGSQFRIDNRVVFPALGPAASVQPPRYVQIISPRRTGGFIGSWTGRRGWVAGALDPSGRPIGKPVRVSSRSPAFRELAHAVDGSFAIFWQDDNGVRLRRFGADLRPLGPETEVVPPGRDIRNLLFASGPDGRTAAAWFEGAFGDGSEGFQAYVRLFGPDGQPESGRMRVEGRLVADSLLFPEALAMNRQGRALLAWSELLPGGGTIPERFGVQLWSAAGPASEPMDLGSTLIQAAVFPSFCADAAAAGRSFVVTWLGDAPGSGTKAIYARRFFSAD